MTVQPSPASNQLQHFINGISARLAQLAKDPPDLVVYLRAHAECIDAGLKPVGFSYEMQNGPVFQAVFRRNVESLGYRESPEQENAFQRALRLAAAQRKPLLIPANTHHATGVQGLSVEDSPAPDELPLFNRTPYEQMFIPILLGESAVGVLHVWFQPAAGAASQTRMTLLKQICGEIELYLKARRARDVSQEVTRLSTYSRLLEELAGDTDLESVSWNLVNYAREAVACERVCLFIANNYDRALSSEPLTGELEYEFELHACSGLKKPHPRSEQAMTLQRVAQKLTQMSLVKTGVLPAATDAAEPAPAAEASEPAGNGVPAPRAAEKPAGKPEAPAASAGPGGTDRPRMQITLMVRDPAKTATRPPEVNEYFDLMPMNWATVIPLFDRDQRVCGILLFEGAKVEEKLGNSLKPMLELAVSAGRALGTALYWNQHRSLRLARSFVNLRQSYVSTPARRKWLRIGLPVAIALAVLLFPITYRIKGNASVLAVKQTTLPALVNARLLEVNVREGQAVRQGDVLARFDTRDLELQLRQLDQEYERSLLESDTALTQGNEPQMQMARLNAAKAAAMTQKIRRDIDHATLRAPFDGLVLGAQTLSTRIGEVLRLGDPLLEVVDPNAWQVKASLREQDLIQLDERLRAHGPLPASLRLAANPAHRYELELSSDSQLAYGLDTTNGKYEFTAVLPLNASLDDPGLMKSGFTGRISFEAGTRPVAYVLFKDFVRFMLVRFF